MDKAYQQTIDTIQNELKKQGLSQRQLALKAKGTTPQSLSRLLNGKSVPTVSYLGRLAEAMGKELKISFTPIKPSKQDQ